MFGPREGKYVKEGKDAGGCKEASMDEEGEAELAQWLGPKSDWSDGQWELYRELPWLGRRFLDAMRLFPSVGRWIVNATAERAEARKSDRDRG
jgi:hypothetical protein